MRKESPWILLRFYFEKLNLNDVVIKSYLENVACNKKHNILSILVLTESKFELLFEHVSQRIENTDK